MTVSVAYAMTPIHRRFGRRPVEYDRDSVEYGRRINGTLVPAVVVDG